MIRRIVAVVLAVLMASPAFAQSLRESINRAATAAAAQQPEPARTGMHPGLLWTGVGLLAGGGLTLGLGAAEDPENETCVSGDDLEETCVSNRTVLLTSGAVMAGVGGLLLWIGAVKARDNAPSVTFGPGRFVVQQRLPLHAVFGR